MRKICAILSLLFASLSFAGSNAPIIFSGNYAKTLVPWLNLDDSVYIINGTADPSITAQTAPKGSLYQRTGSSGGSLWVKIDNGLSTNWSQVGNSLTVVGPGSSTDNAIARWDGTTGLLIQNSSATIDDSGNFTTGTWQATKVAEIYGGTNQSTYATGDTLYSSATNTLSKLAGNTTTTKKLLSQTGTGTLSQAPSWAVLVGSDLPNPSSSTLGGVESYASVSHQWINTISTSGVPASTQPAFTDISGVATGAQLPNPSSSTLGGVQSYAAVSNQWINAISTSGVPSSTQPAFTNISGNLATAQLPTAQTWPASGTVQATTPNNHGVLVSGSGATATVIAPDASTSKVLVSGGSSADPAWSLLTNSNLSGSAAITNANHATMLTGTVKGNISGSTAVPSDVAAVSTNTNSSVVVRDSSGNFSAGTVSAALTGTASGNTTYTANNHGVVLSGSANAMTVVAPDASTAKALISGGSSADPAWGTLAIGGGGTGQVTKAAAFDALSPMSTLGDIIYGGASGTGTRLAGNTTAVKQYFSQTGTGSVSAAPAWSSFTNPTIQKFTSGSSATYTTPAGVTYIRVVLVGGGGGGAGSGTASTGDGVSGTASTFGTTLLSGGGGTGATTPYDPGSGGSSSLGTGPIGIALSGGDGHPGSIATVSGTVVGGGTGGSSAFGGAGAGGAFNDNAANGKSGTGGGGGGGQGLSTASQAFAGAGGGSGGYVDAMITGPSATYTYTVGAGGSGGSAGTSGFAGGNGGSGLIVVYEYYQ